MKNKKNVIIFMFLMVLALGGTAVAYMVHRTNVQTNTFQLAQIGCLVTETFDGYTTKTSIKVHNKIDENTPGDVDAYIRVRLVSYWVDSGGNIVGKPSEMPAFDLANGWIADTSNNTYYYKQKVEPGYPTGELLASPITLETSAEGYRQVVEIFAEAIQAEPVQAVTDSWGVTLNAAGEITAVQ